MKTSCPSRLTCWAAVRRCIARLVGGSAINQLILKNIQPVKVHEGSKIKDLIVDLQNEMKAGPSNWLAKAINQNKGPDPERFNNNGR